VELEFLSYSFGTEMLARKGSEEKLSMGIEEYRRLILILHCCSCFYDG